MAARGAAKLVRLVAVIGVGALACLQIVRTAAVADRDIRPGLAATLWHSHPAVMTDNALVAIAAAAARGQPVPPTVQADLHRIAAKAPLSPDPFLIEGAIAETEGRSGDAERLLLEARARDPRSRGTRFLLAERFFRTNRVTDALIEMQALFSLQPGTGSQPFINALVAYAATPNAVQQLKAFLREYPRVEAAVLFTLAGDAANADLVLALANVSNPDPDWRGRLILSLANAGQYARAHAIWIRHSGGQSVTGLFNPSFQELRAPPPFNWGFPESSEGVAEPDGRGGLEVLYYGRANAVLANQMLLLRPGRYRLAMSVEGAGAEGAVRWFVRCAKPDKTLGELPLREGSNDLSFDVPPGCEAQWVELRGVAGDLPRTSEFTIRGLELSRGAGR